MRTPSCALDEALFDGMASGEVERDGARAARRRWRLEGDLGLVVSFQRLFPGPPRSPAQELGSRPA